MAEKNDTQLQSDLDTNFANTKSGIFHTIFRAFMTDIIDSKVSLSDFSPSDYIKFTDEGGLAVRLTNKTGAASVKGTLVGAGTTVAKSFEINPADNPKPIGVVYEDGIADGELCWVVTAGLCQVLLEDTTAATAGYWVKVSDNDAGRADAQNLSPPGGTITALEDHLSEIGHCLESVSAGTDKLCWILMHFN